MLKQLKTWVTWELLGKFLDILTTLFAHEPENSVVLSQKRNNLLHTIQVHVVNNVVFLFLKNQTFNLIMTYCRKYLNELRTTLSKHVHKFYSVFYIVCLSELQDTVFKGYKM